MNIMGERAPSVVGLNTTENGTVSGGDGHSLCSSDRPLITGISSVAETSRERMTPGRGLNNNPDILSIPDNRITSFAPVILEIIKTISEKPDTCESEFELGPATSGSPPHSKSRGFKSFYQRP